MSSQKNNNTRPTITAWIWKYLLFLVLMIVVVIIIITLAMLKLGVLPVLPVVVLYVIILALFAFFYPTIRAYQEACLLGRLDADQLAKALKSIDLAEESVLTAKGVARLTIALTLILVLGIALFLLIVYGLPDTSAEIVKSSFATLLGVTASVVAFYFGARTAETSSKSEKREAPPSELIITVNDIFMKLLELTDRKKQKLDDEIIKSEASRRGEQSKKIPEAEQTRLNELLKKHEDILDKDVLNFFNLARSR